MEKEDKAGKKRIIVCRHYYKGKEHKDGGDEVVHKHTVTIVQKEEGGELKDFCNHDTGCTGRYFAVEKRRIDCPFKSDES